MSGKPHNTSLAVRIVEYLSTDPLSCSMLQSGSYLARMLRSIHGMIPHSIKLAIRLDCPGVQIATCPADLRASCKGSKYAWARHP
jgi:hypothetical protein